MDDLASASNAPLTADLLKGVVALCNDMRRCCVHFDGKWSTARNLNGANFVVSLSCDRELDRFEVGLR